MGFLIRLQTERTTSMFGISSFMAVSKRRGHSDVCGEQIGDHSPLGHTSCQYNASAGIWPRFHIASNCGFSQGPRRRPCMYT